MQKELLSPDTFTKQLQSHRQQLQKVLDLKQKSQKTAPQGHLKIMHPVDGRPPQFYHITNPKDFNGTYIPRAQISFIKKLAQKDYDLKLIKILQAQVRALDKLIDISLSKPDSELKIEQLYSRMISTRQKLIVPVTLTDAQYTEEWQNVSWQGRSFSDEAPGFTTVRGERVRSKSEIIIADTLNRLYIPYRYEYPLELKGGQIFHPDFLCLNVRTRQEFIWEHFGMMDNPEYLENAIEKIRLYNDSNYFLGKNLIITMESQHRPLNTRQLEQIIKTYLC